MGSLFRSEDMHLLELVIPLEAGTGGRRWLRVGWLWVEIGLAPVVWLGERLGPWQGPGTQRWWCVSLCLVDSIAGWWRQTAAVSRNVECL